MVEPENGFLFNFNESFPMKSDILRIRKEMTNFNQKPNAESSHVSSIVPESQVEEKVHCKKCSLRKTPKTDFCECQNLEKNKVKKASNILLPILRKTVKTLRHNTIYRPPDDIKEYHLNIINDQSAFIFKESPENYNFLLKLHVFKPFHPIVVFFKALSLVNLLFLFLYTPLEAGFWKYFDNKINNVLIGLFLLVFIAEALCKMNTSYFYNGTLIKERIDIFLNYLQKHALVDFLAILAIFLEYFLQRDPESTEYLLIKLLKFLIFVKGAQFKRLYDEFVQNFKIDVRLKGSLPIIELFVVSLFFAHVTACLWYLSGCLSLKLEFEQSWFFTEKIINLDWKCQYLYSFYWAVVVMMTVGFGDIIPRNVVEVSFCIIAIFTGCALYAYNLNKIGIILQNIYREENEFKEELRIINNFMERKKIDSGLQARIKEYLRFIWNEKKTEHNAKEMEIIESLSNSLKEELLLESYGGIIKAFPLFYKNFTEKTMKSMVSCIKEIKFVPGDNIFEVKILIFKINKIYRKKYWMIVQFIILTEEP